MMNGKLVAGSTVEIRLPDDSSFEYKNAASILCQELVRRSTLRVIVAFPNVELEEPNADLTVQLLSVNDLTDEMQDRIDPPVTILPYPDYADRINLRTQEDGSLKKILVICGSHQSLIYGVGALFRFFRFDDEGVSWELTDFDLQPLTPLRGCFFETRKESGFFQHGTDARCGEIALNHALWGNNVIGFDSERTFDCDEVSLYPSLLIRCDLNSRLNESQNIRFIWLQNEPSCVSVEGMYFEIRSRINRHTDGNREFWIDCDGYSDDRLSELFDFLIKETNPAVKALVCGSDHPLFCTIKREMPLSMQLVSMSCISDSLRGYPERLAKLFFDAAPLTYGAMVASRSEDDELTRFIWSLLSWSPQPEIDEFAELYGHRFFGSPAASAIRDAVLAFERGDRQAIHCLNMAEASIPKCMTPLAEPRMQILRRTFDRRLHST